MKNLVIVNQAVVVKPKVRILAGTILRDINSANDGYMCVYLGADDYNVIDLSNGELCFKSHKRLSELEQRVKDSYFKPVEIKSISIDLKEGY